MQELTVKGMCLAACVMSCAAAMSMPSRNELKSVQGLVNELMRSDVANFNARKMSAADVAAEAQPARRPPGRTALAGLARTVHGEGRSGGELRTDAVYGVGSRPPRHPS